MATRKIENHGNMIASDRVEGTAVYNRQDQRLGHISHVMIDKSTGQAGFAVLSFGSFLGIGADYYPIPWSMLTYDVEKGGYVVDLAKKVLDEAPRYTSDLRPEYDEIYGRSVYQHYGLIYPW